MTVCYVHPGVIYRLLEHADNGTMSGEYSRYDDQLGPYALVTHEMNVEVDGNSGIRTNLLIIEHNRRIWGWTYQEAMGKHADYNELYADYSFLALSDYDDDADEQEYIPEEDGIPFVPYKWETVSKIRWVKSDD